MKIAILGFGREGHSILKFLRKTRINADYHADKRGYKNIGKNQRKHLRKHLRKSAADEILVLDKNRNVKVPRGVKTHLGKNYLKNLERFDVIFRSPGIPYFLPEIQKAKKQGVKISSATNLFFERYPGKIVGITGTKGKGTTATLLYKILGAAGKDVFLAGNIGKPSLDLLSNTQINADSHAQPRLDGESRRADKRRYKNISENQRSNQRESVYIILELSSFQLQDLKKSPSIAAVLDIFPDHLDAHKNLKEYYDAKANIARYQKSGDKIFFFKNNNLSRHVASKSKGKKISVNEKSFKLFSQDDLLIKGAHNFKNAVMAAIVAKSLGVSEKIILETAKKFKGLHYRTQLIKKIRGVSYYNDSASTNPFSTIAALKSFSQPVILICGGASKNTDFKKFGGEAGKMAKKIILFGQNKKEMRKTIKTSSKIKMAGTLNEAVKIAFSLSSPGDVVLFSPASTSFDMFDNYIDRGRAFDKIIKALN
ncbi:MAG: UDP-N-acetylmuramoylalanine--D-glutamate ligase [Candidatus Liptonbacteria bacterium RIFCSPLOWO2_01_FULL_45_15]|uniref:UDP-N-acetylmuramoylalanine--D-glutamate ligase n=1 Tax=Candidatus Liptonbacteria bacterium RIFCSPLOWO2_01_FULL_45_15 TaxID=1798649 RepID=A0A1G2CHA8_9BACT|nr:MAG: UDP-N-acetylmuramoylalanine--D-glutamate ligase [Candidatus Liptonbacteria bacterium RIFCSPLOWO2_01_FULL_45_15]